MYNLVKKLTQAFGVSGNEEEIREVIKKEIQGHVDEMYTDTLGNLIAVKKGTGKKIMLAAHMDEIGVMAIFIDDKGFIRFSNIGGINPFYALGQRVKFKNGITGTVFYEDKLESMKDLKLAKMYIDIGGKCKAETAEKIKIGDTACFMGDCILENNMIISKALDDRSGCAVLIKTLQNMTETKNEIYFVFTVQEELGLRGARTAAYQIMPDSAIAVDVTLTGDTPECKPMEVKCGDGPAIKIKDNSIICHPEIRTLLEQAGKKVGIPYQFEILEFGGSDPGSIHITAGGIPSGAISIPCRYVHSTIERVDVGDMENAVKMLVQAIQ